MKHPRLKLSQKKMYAEKLIDLSHLIAAGTIIGQFLSGRPFSLFIAIAGLFAVVALYVISYNLTK